MNCEHVLHQIEVAVKSVIKIVDTLEEADLQKKPTANKHSVGQLLEHIAVICKANWLISDQATLAEMASFYEEVSYQTLDSIKEGLLTNFEFLKKNYRALSQEELQTETTSHWGLVYTRYEWLLEAVSHIYHHRGQLHAILVHCYDMDPEISLFE